MKSFVELQNLPLLLGLEHLFWLIGTFGRSPLTLRSQGSWRCLIWPDNIDHHKPFYGQRDRLLLISFLGQLKKEGCGRAYEDILLVLLSTVNDGTHHTQ